MKKERAASPLRAAISFAAFCLLFAAVIALFLFCFPELGGYSRPMSAQLDASGSLSPLPVTVRRQIILDAGHGGVDSGALSADGIAEKDLNLRLTGKLAALLSQCGYEVILTRRDDVMLSDGGAGSRKTGDLRARLALSRAYPDALFLSIHMNTYPSPLCRGLQVYYTPNRASARRLAQCVQETVRTLLQSENDRQIKAADSSIYLLDRSESCAVLIECGFLSCPDEARLLADEAYQDRLAAAIVSAVVSFSQGGDPG